GPNVRPSDYWTEELQNIDYMFDASPLVVERLRHHCYHITGVWPYQYRTHKDRVQHRHQVKLEALLDAGSPRLFVPESPSLGGFGFETEHGLVNVDTLKYFEVTLALERANALQPFAQGERRAVAWEIGSGWGGFAYVFKTLFPNTTYVMSDLPELFLYSGTYLSAVFPDATVTYWNGPGEPIDWEASDFVFVPAHALDAVQPPSVDLALNMISFQEMSTEQVEAYVAHAHALGTPYFYSLNRERSLYNPELLGVTAIMQKRFWLHEIEVLPVAYTDMPETIPTVDRKERKRRQQGERALSPEDERRYRHVVGWPRIDL
ncbi:MAG TPA: putative sugar O-methyltransferase, partial [Rhodothermales bacterium]